MRIPIVICVFLAHVSAESSEATEKPALMERLVKTLPQIPNVIKGQMEGSPEELKKMISSMLGDGLLSQLVVNPMGVAENMGVPLNDLGINTTVIDQTVAKSTGSEVKDSGLGNIISAFMGGSGKPATTTPSVLYVDGVPVRDMDAYIRRHGLEKHGYSTKSPPTTTTPLSSEKIAEVVLERLKSQETPVLASPPRQGDLESSLDMNLIDPSRVAEVNKLLRRAPQKFATGAPLDIDIGPPGFVQSLDPAIDEVVTNLRTRGGYGLSVDDVKRLQNILQTYEQTLQTKELLTKRKQLQVLSTELTEQRKRIEVQKKMEEDLRRKEKELEDAQTRMEQQLRDQLNSWHSSFGPTGQRPAVPFDLSGAAPPSPPTIETPTTQLPTTTTTESIAPEITSSHERKLAEERENIVEQQMQPVPPPQPIKISSALRHHIRYSPTQQTPSEIVPPSTSVKKESDDEFVSKCDCEQINFDKMNGKWVIALASTGVAEKINTRISDLIEKENEKLTCSRFDFNAGKQSVAAQDARLVWQFKTSSIGKMLRLRGNALTMDHESVRVQMTDFDGENFSFPFCVLKSGGTSSYDHILVTNSQGDCKDVALLVRDPQEFFDNPDKKLQRYLKSKIANKEMNSLDVVEFGDC